MRYRRLRPLPASGRLALSLVCAVAAILAAGLAFLAGAVALGSTACGTSIDRGSISVMARGAEGTSNYRTLEDLDEALDSESFWRPHRSFLVNIHHIKEVVPWFNSTYMLKMSDKKQTEIPVSRSQIKRMRELFKL